jgi:hypothetical protein
MRKRRYEMLLPLTHNDGRPVDPEKHEKTREGSLRRGLHVASLQLKILAPLRGLIGPVPRVVKLDQALGGCVRAFDSFPLRRRNEGPSTCFAAGFTSSSRQNAPEIE